MTPMLARLASAPFDDKDWIFEIKYDGFRALTFKDKGVTLLSRNHKSFNDRFPDIVKALEKLPGRCILDGEIVMLDEKKRSRFQLLQNVGNQKAKAYYYIFDILSYEGKDLRSLPLLKRKAFLKTLLSHNHSKCLQFSTHVTRYGKKFFLQAKKKGLEGIMAKRSDSPYLSSRSSDWLKIKAKQGQEFVIGGFTQPRGRRKYFGSLLLGIYQRGKLIYVGHVGTGFNHKMLASLYKTMLPLKRSTSPFSIEPPPNNPVTWIRPKLVCEIAFAEWTDKGILRQPTFKGLRTDKDPQKVTRERASY